MQLIDARARSRSDATSGGSHDPTDAVLIARSVYDPAAFEQIYERHHDAVFRYAVSRVGVAPAEDVVGEVFLAALSARRKFNPALASGDDASALPWLLGIATKRIARQRASQRRWLDTCAAAFADPADAPEHEGDRSLERADAARIRGALLRALDDLSAREREPLLLYVFADLAYEDIAIALDIPVGTVRSRISRARTRMAGILDGEPR